MPFAFYHLGVVLTVVGMLTMTILNHVSTMMYMKVKDLTPQRYESIYEIFFLLFGRPSIFLVCAVMFISNLGALIMQYIIIGNILNSFAE